jgi:ATP-dependent 26S proteasome regulatory subunit
MPGIDERDQIWRVQMHPTLTPLAGDVDFRALAETYEVSGGDIRNAVLKAAMAAASEPGGDALKVIHHRHLEAGIQDVLAGKRVMQQSLFHPEKRIRRPDTALATLLGVIALLVALAALIVALLR